MIKKIIIFLVGWKALIIFFAFIATFTFPMNFVFTPHDRYYYPYIVYVWGNFDGEHYLNIAESGYFPYQQAFFPLYPIIIRIVANAIDYKYLIAGLFISHVAFILGLFVVWKLLILDNHKKFSLFLLLVLLMYPTSPFYGAVYNDSLFFFLATLCIYMGRKQEWLLAALIGALATLTRLNGLALFFYLLFEYLYKSELAPKSKEQFFNLVKKTISSTKLKYFFTKHVYSIIFIPFTFLSYLIYVQYTQGDWNMVFSSMKIWNQDQITFPLQVIWRYLKIIFLDRSFSISYWVAAIEFLFVIWYLIISIHSYTRIRFSYWVFMNLSFLIPSLTGTFAGMPRYGLHIYPFFFYVTIFLTERSLTIKILYFLISIVLMFIVVMFFTRGYFIA